MSLQVYYPDDIKNALLAAEYVMQFTTNDDRFAQGYHVALVTIALSFGLVQLQLDNKNEKDSSRLLIG